MDGAARVARALSEVMNDRGHDSAEVAELAGLSRSTVDAVRKGTRRKSHEETFRKLDAYVRLDAGIGMGDDERRTMAIFRRQRVPSYFDPPTEQRWAALREEIPPRQLQHLIGFLEGTTWRAETA